MQAVIQRALARATLILLLAGPASAALQVELVKDICPGGCSGLDHRLATPYASTSTRLFFLAAPVGGGSPDYNMWVSDGTAAGTFQLHDAFPTNSYSRHAWLTRVGERVYFDAITTGGAWGLFESDGTPTGTREVPFPDVASSDRYAIAIVDWNGQAWFVQDGALYRIASLGAAPEAMTPFAAASEYERMVVRNGVLYAYGRSCKTCVEPAALWRIQADGSKSPVVGFPVDKQVSLYDGPGGVYAYVRDYNEPHELWRVADAGTVAPFHADVGSGFVAHGTHGGRWHFAGNDAEDRQQLWSTDGTPAGTQKLTALPTSPYGPAPSFLSGYSGQRYGAAEVNGKATLFRLDATHPQGARQLRRFDEVLLAPGATTFVAYADRLFFAVARENGADLWSSDGTPGGTQKVALPPPASGIDYIYYPIAAVNGWLYFRRSSYALGTELWRIRGDPSDFPTFATQHVVEYYNPSRDHYFMTGQSDEIAGLDSGVFAGWQRTGEGFTTYAPGASDPEAAPVCRFYGLPSAGLDSHFYSAYLEECKDIVARFSGAWFLETMETFDVGHARADGSCPSGFVPLYRTFNQRSDINHRYTTDFAIQDQMALSGWRREGFGYGVAMCVLARDAGQ